MTRTIKEEEKEKINYKVLINKRIHEAWPGHPGPALMSVMAIHKCWGFLVGRRRQTLVQLQLDDRARSHLSWCPRRWSRSLRVQRPLAPAQAWARLLSHSSVPGLPPAARTPSSTTWEREWERKSWLQLVWWEEIRDKECVCLFHKVFVILFGTQLRC